MKITVKVRYGSTKQRFESFGGDRYIAYLASGETDEGSFEEIISMISSSLGVPKGRIEFISDAPLGNKIFQLV